MSASETSRSPLLQVQGLTKHFPGVLALSDVTFDVRPGEVHALVGENGAGKSTLIKLISGVYQPDRGTMLRDGLAVQPANPREAQALGIATIYQESSLYPELSVAENVLMGALPRRAGGLFVDWPRTEAGAREVLQTIGVELDVRRKVAGLSIANQQRIEIAKALSRNARVLIMDEPTAALSQHDVARLLELVRNLRSRGVGIVYISHRLEEVFEVADRVTVLRDGRVVGTQPVADVTQGMLINMMVGRTLDTLFPKMETTPGQVALRIHNLHQGKEVVDVSFAVRQGEIVGLAGLVGSGRSELAQTIFGITPAQSGTIEVHGQAVRIKGPRDAMQHGIAYIPEDRQHQGLVLPMSVKENITLPTLRSWARAGFVARRDESQIADEYVAKLGVRTPSIHQIVGNLSGGNQQKVVVSKWLLTKPKILIVDEPTHGVDVGAKAEIHRLLSQLAADGLAILMISSELPEVLGMSDRVLVLRKGHIVAEFSRADADQERVLAAALGTDPAVTEVLA